MAGFWIVMLFLIAGIAMVVTSIVVVGLVCGTVAAVGAVVYVVGGKMQADPKHQGKKLPKVLTVSGIVIMVLPFVIVLVMILVGAIKAAVEYRSEGVPDNGYSVSEEI